MKWLRTIVVLDRGNILNEPEWRAIHKSYVRSIQSIEHPANTGKLTLRRKIQNPDGQWKRNGVGFLRRSFINHIVNSEGWKPEHLVDIHLDRKPPELMSYPGKKPYREPITSEFGGFDFLTRSRSGLQIAIEWETGNISSSHRSMNKLTIALSAGVIQAGVLIVPSRECYKHLTDRIGNIGELSGYLELWSKADIKRGLLAISVVEHDSLTDDPKIPYLPMGTDGRSRRGRIK